MMPDYVAYFDALKKAYKSAHEELPASPVRPAPTETQTENWLMGIPLGISLDLRRLADFLEPTPDTNTPPSTHRP